MLVARSLRQLLKFSRLRTPFSQAKIPVFQELLASKDSKSLEQASTILANLESEASTLASTVEKTKEDLKFIKSTEGNLQQKLEAIRRNVKEQEDENQLVLKRTQKEFDNASNYSITKMVKQLLDVADNMKRCSSECKKINADKKDEFSSKLHEAHQSLVQAFGKFGIKEFDPTGEKYDPNTSESMVEVPDPSKESGSVAMTTQTGYMIKDRVLRSAKVCVYRN